MHGLSFEVPVRRHAAKQESRRHANRMVAGLTAWLMRAQGRAPSIGSRWTSSSSAASVVSAVAGRAKGRVSAGGGLEQRGDSSDRSTDHDATAVVDEEIDLKPRRLPRGARHARGADVPARVGEVRRDLPEQPAVEEHAGHLERHRCLEVDDLELCDSRRWPRRG